ncbi:MAG: choice-of-anchor P family protein [Acidimicrobiales bacterium]
MITEPASGAYGYFTDIGFFGAPKEPRGPAPEVGLPPGDAPVHVTAAEPTAVAQYGPPTLFSSGPLEVGTRRSPYGLVSSWASVQKLNRSGEEVFTAERVQSTCSAWASGACGFTQVTGGRLALGGSVVDIPGVPAPNTSYEGTIPGIGDRFRAVVNEQHVGDGSITINAVHVYLLGPNAVGDVIIGQSRCRSRQ